MVKSRTFDDDSPEIIKIISVVFTPANGVWGKIIFSQASVCPRGGLGVCADTTPGRHPLIPTPPPGQNPPADNPPGQTPL